jgi:antibiotic biosynthesis monooxygenase (ABM) superfamily enzyme
MISRIWRGWTTFENADAYQALVSTRIFPGIAARKIIGYRGAHLLRRDLTDEVEFVTILWFDSLDAVKSFLGDDYETAYILPEARAVLAHFDERVAHYETLLEP